MSLNEVAKMGVVFEPLVMFLVRKTIVPETTRTAWRRGNQQWKIGVNKETEREKLQKIISTSTEDRGKPRQWREQRYSSSAFRSGSESCPVMNFRVLIILLLLLRTKPERKSLNPAELNSQTRGPIWFLMQPNSWIVGRPMVQFIKGLFVFFPQLLER